MSEVLPFALFAVALAAVALGLAAAARRSVVGSRSFTLMMAGVAVWSAAYGMRLLAATPEAAAGWTRIAYLAATFVPIAFFVLCLRLAQVTPSLLLVAAVSIVPLATILVAVGPLGSAMPWMFRMFAFHTIALAAVSVAFLLRALRRRAFSLLNILPVARGQLIDTMEDLVFVIDPAGRLADINPAAQHELHMIGEDVIGRHVTEVFARYGELTARYRKPREVREDVEVEVAGVRRWFDLSVTLLHDRSQRLTGSLVVMRDITARKRMEETVRESELKYRTILETIGEGYFELDLRGTIIACNDVLRKILGYPADEMIGLNYREYAEPGTADFLKEVAIRIYETGQILTGLLHRVSRPDGTTVFVEFSAMPVLGADGARIGFRGLVRDVSDRVRVDAELRTAQERIANLLDGSRVADDLRTWVAAVAHELESGIRAERLSVWEVDGDSMLPLTEAARAAPPLAEVQSISVTGAGLIESPTGSIVPVLTTSGELCAVLLLEGRREVLNVTEQRILLTFARQLGAALEMIRLRRQLATAEERRAISRRELQARGVELLQICPACGRCYGDDATVCSEEGIELTTPYVLPYRLLNRYRFVRTLGSGGMGIVLSAADEKLSREVAIKILRADAFDNDALRHRFEREARAVAQVQHSGVIALFDAGELEDGTTFLVVERLHGADLGWVIGRYGRGSRAQVATVVRQAGAAVAAAHRAGVVHRDVKPGNIFLTNDSEVLQVKILDFGLAKPASLDGATTHSGIIVGTPAYMAPEQLEGKRVDGRADVYSLACVAYEALLGVRAVTGTGLADLIVHVMRETPAPPSTLLPSLTPEVDDIFAAGLAKDPSARPADIEKWASSLASALESLSHEPDIHGWPAQPVRAEFTPVEASFDASGATTRLT